MERIKVAVVLPYFGHGGVEQTVSLLVSHYDTESFDVRVFCVYGEPQGNAMEERVRAHGVPIVYIGKGLGVSLSAVRKLDREFDEFSPDVVHTNLSSAAYCGYWCLSRKVKLLHTIHNVPGEEAKSGVSRAIRRFLISRKVMVPIAISETNRRLTADFYGIEADSIPVAVTAADLSVFRPGDGVGSDFDFINVARLDVQKNQTMLLDAMATVLRDRPETTLAIVGDGPLRDQLESQVDSKGLSAKVRLLGRRDDIPDLLRRSRIFVMSSDWEGLPLSIIEAMATGLPIVSTSVGGIPDVVGENGILVEPGDMEGLASAMLRVIGDGPTLARMGRASVEASRKYDIDSVARCYEGLYRQYAKTGSPNE